MLSETGAGRMRLRTGLAAAVLTVSSVADGADGQERQDGKTAAVDRAGLDSRGFRSRRRENPEGRARRGVAGRAARAGSAPTAAGGSFSSIPQFCRESGNRRCSSSRRRTPRRSASFPARPSASGRSGRARPAWRSPFSIRGAHAAGNPGAHPRPGRLSALRQLRHGEGPDKAGANFHPVLDDVKLLLVTRGRTTHDVRRRFATWPTASRG